MPVQSGSCYTLYDHGRSADKAVTDSSLRRELAVIFFDYDKMGPGRMRVAVPRVNDSGTAVTFKPRAPEDGLEAAALAEDRDRVMFLDNKVSARRCFAAPYLSHVLIVCMLNLCPCFQRPKWDDAVGGHVLNFHGRVTKSSIKNFQLACETTGDATVLQFGRVGDETFTMDYEYPLSAVQAFAICLASMDGKIADSKGFERWKGFKESASGMFRRMSKK